MRVSVLGRNGLIGRELYKRFDEVYSYPRKDVDVIFWFASPSSQILFKHAPEYCLKETVAGIQNILEFCIKYNIKLIFPSTVSFGNEYAHCKSYIEKIPDIFDYKNALNVKIAAGYGNEKHKGEYASVVYQFCKLMKQGKRPIIFGDGEQTRDFIYIKDIVDNIIKNLDKTGVIEIGTGINTSFNELVFLINEELGTNIEPLYIDKPQSYLQEAKCKPVPVKYSLREGIREVLKCI